MPNNPALYDAVIAGASGGNLERWLTNDITSQLPSFENSVIAFAAAVDSAIAIIPGGPSTAEVRLLQSLTQGVMANRLLKSSNASDYSEVSSAIASVFQNLREELIAAPDVGSVSSVFTRQGDVVAEKGDYNSDLVLNESSVPGATVTDALNAVSGGGGGAVLSIFGRGGVVTAMADDYSTDLIENLSDVAGDNATEALNALNDLILGLVTGVSSVFGRTGTVSAKSGDYTSNEIDNSSGVGGGAGSVSTALDALATLIAGLDSDNIANSSTIGGGAGSVSTALDALATVILGLGSNDIANDSGVSGASVTNALTTLASAIAALVTGVSSVYGRTGAVVAKSSDYTSDQIDNDSTVGGGAGSVTTALDALATAIAALVTGVSSVYGRTGAVVAKTDDYAASQINNDSAITATGVAAALNALRTAAGWAIANPVDLNNNDVTEAKTINYKEEIDNGNSGAADTIDWTAGNAQRSTLTGNVTYTFTAPAGVGGLSLKIIQDATGNRTITWPAAVKNTTALNAALTKTASTTSIVSMYWDGTNYWPGILCTGVA